MKEILRSQWNYILSEKDEKLVFSVMCGMSALYEVNVSLNKYDVQSYEKQGEAYLKNLAEEIRTNPESYSDRYINLYDHSIV